MEAKTTVVKSKSSNSAITSRSEHRNKMSRSTAEVQKMSVKKRGVYVEKRNMKMGLNETETNAIQEKLVKAPPRPKPGNKKFRSSILTILSKSTTGTQHPDTNASEVTKKDRRKPLRKREQTYEDESIKKRNRFRSKALNNNVGKVVAEHQIVVLQSQKDITQTPSMYSENDSLNSQLPLMNRKGSNGINVDFPDEKNFSELNNVVVKEFLEGKQLKKGKRVRIDEPVTLVDETSDKTNENNEGLYNFFVNLLENTISMSEVNDEYDRQTERSEEASTTKMPLEINESVAEKLNIQCDCRVKQEDTCCNETNRFYCFNNDELVRDTQQLPASTIADSHKAPKAKQLKAKSFSFIAKAKPKQNKITAESVIIDKKKCSNRKHKKQTLLNLFKEQLRMDHDAFDEPQSLYQALKVIAENKRRNEETKRFEEKIRRTKEDSGFPECVYRRRKVILPGKRGNKKDKRDMKAQNGNKNNSELSNTKKKTNGVDYSFPHNPKTKSNYSLKVSGFDYENEAVKKQASNKLKEIILTYNSTPSDSEHEIVYDDNELSLPHYSGSFFDGFTSPSLKSWLV